MRPEVRISSCKSLMFAKIPERLVPVPVAMAVMLIVRGPELYVMSICIPVNRYRPELLDRDDAGGGEPLIQLSDVPLPTVIAPLLMLNADLLVVTGISVTSASLPPAASVIAERRPLAVTVMARAENPEVIDGSVMVAIVAGTEPSPGPSERHE